MHGKIFLTAVFFIAQTYAQSIDISRYVEPTSVTKTYLYRSDSSASGQTIWSIAGKIVHTSLENEEIDDLERRVMQVQTEDLPDSFPTDYKIYHWQQSEGLYTGYYESENWIESLAIASNVNLNQPWSTSANNFWHTEKLTAVIEHESAAGSFQDCLEIERQQSSAQTKGQLTEISIYCPSVGLVNSTTTHQIDNPQFNSTTVQQLISVINF